MPFIFIDENVNSYGQRQIKLEHTKGLEKNSNSFKIG